MMQVRGEGLIINITSLAGRLPVPFMAAYNAAKAAMASLPYQSRSSCRFTSTFVDLQPGEFALTSTRRHEGRET